MLKIGFLVPLNDKLEENTSNPRIPIVNGPNIVGRDSVPVADKRLSRKHLSVTASADGRAHVIVVCLRLMHTMCLMFVLCEVEREL